MCNSRQLQIIWLTYCYSRKWMRMTLYRIACRAFRNISKHVELNAHDCKYHMFEYDCVAWARCLDCIIFLIFNSIHLMLWNIAGIAWNIWYYWWYGWIWRCNLFSIQSKVFLMWFAWFKAKSMKIVSAYEREHGNAWLLNDMRIHFRVFFRSRFLYFWCERRGFWKIFYYLDECYAQSSNLRRQQHGLWKTAKQCLDDKPHSSIHHNFIHDNAYFIFCNQKISKESGATQTIQSSSSIVGRITIYDSS